MPEPSQHEFVKDKSVYIVPVSCMHSPRSAASNDTMVPNMLDEVLQGFAQHLPIVGHVCADSIFLRLLTEFISFNKYELL